MVSTNTNTNKMEVKSIKVAVLKINDLSFSILKIEEDTKAQFDSRKLKISNSIISDIILEKEVFWIEYEIKYLYPIREKEEVLLSLAVLIEYSILELKKIVKGNAKSLSLPDGLYNDLLINTIATVRGIMYEKTKNYFINKYTLPLFNPRHFKSKNPISKSPTKSLKK